MVQARWLLGFCSGWRLGGVVLVVLALSLLAASPGLSQDGQGFGAPGADPDLDSDLDPKKIQAAIVEGLKWLRQQQNPTTGQFKSSYNSFYPMGPTAMAVLTLLKCGAGPNDPAVVKGLVYLKKQPLGAQARIYGVALCVLAIEARFAPPPKVLAKDPDKPYDTVARRIFQKHPGAKADRAWMRKLVEWIVSKQQTNVWRYPGAASDGKVEDLSNAQYALFALKAASRLGVKVSPEVFRKALPYFIREQERDGPAVDYFPVPAADGPIANIKKRSSRLGSPRRRGGSSSGGTQERDRGEGTEGGEHPTMQARGWGYLPKGNAGGSEGTGGAPGPAGGGGEHRPTGSMTAAGVAGAVICKSELEADRGFWSKWRPQTNQSIRDGCAWLAQNFSVTSNPGSGGWHYYYLYGLERAGVMAGTYDFGPHDWYDEGGRYILAQQNSDGSWGRPSPGGGGGNMLPTNDALPDTCFALLFLKRATIPVVKLPPKRVITGGGSYGGGD